MAPFGFHRPVAPVALLTDFGLQDAYVGVMKGVIRKICPEASVIDLSHGVAPQDVTQAAFLLASAYPYFPEGTVFACVVDPGVGTDRDVVCVCANGQVFLAPDNGLLGIVASRCPPERMFRVTNGELFLDPVSGTFHGRDIFAPVAAHICAGADPARVGAELTRIRRLRLSKPLRTATGALKGEVVYADRFGNLITNITRPVLERTFGDHLGRLEVRVGGERIRGIVRAYGDCEEGQALALFGSSGYLEVAVCGGSAKAAVGCSRGDAVTVTRRGRTT